MSKSVREPVVDGIRNMLCGHIQAARALLDHPAVIDDEAVHSARKHLKHARAGLRLLRRIVGDRRYAIANASLRDAARPLSRVRDAKVLIDTTQELIQDEKDPQCRGVLADVVRSLRRERRTLLGRLTAGDETLKASLASLAGSERGISLWTLDGPRNAVPADTKRLYRRSRRAMRAARDALTDDALHEARKQAKYLAFALEALEVTGTRHVLKSIKRAKELGEQLGADHDLALIQSKLRKLPQSQARIGRKLVVQLKKRRAKLQRKAFRIGRRLHEEKARAFMKRVSVV